MAGIKSVRLGYHLQETPEMTMPPHRNPFSIRRVSSVKAKLNREYTKLREKFLAERPWCEACVRRGLIKTPATQIHHSRGRNRKLQNETRFWFALCERCHHWVHNEQNEARHLGLLCQRGLWGKH